MLPHYHSRSPAVTVKCASPAIALPLAKAALQDLDVPVRDLQATNLIGRDQ